MPTRRERIGGVLLLCAAMAAAGDARAARLPDWASRLAASAPEVPDTITEHPARMLLRERSVRIEASGEVSTRLRTARQVLSARNDFDLEYFPFRRNVEIEFSRVWHLTPEGKTTRSTRADFIDFSIDTEAFITDARTRLIPIEGLERGSLVFVEIRTRETPFDLAFAETFYSPYPLDLAAVEVEAPEDWTLVHEWLRRDGGEPRVSGRLHRWELEELQPLGSDPMAPPGDELAPLLVLSAFPPEGQRPAANVFPGWEQLANWIEGLAAGRHQAGPEVEKAARGLAGNRGPEELPALYARFVRDKVRYLARSVGMDGYRPADAGETLANRFGDCKAKATLLRSMLSTADRLSYPVLVSASEADTVSERIAYLDAFDHMILAIPATEPESRRYPAAVAPHPSLGPLLFVDPTAETVSFGWLPDALAGRQALVVAGEQTRFVELPGSRPGHHRVAADVRVRVRDDGAVEVESRTMFHGQPAADRRRRVRESSSDFRDDWERRLRQTWLEADVEVFEVVPETADGAFLVETHWSSPRSIGSGNERRVQVFAGLGPFVPEPSLRRRETPVRFEHAWRIELSATVEGLPPGATLPDGEQLDGDGWTVQGGFEREGDRVLAHGTFELERTRFAPDEFRDLRRFYRAISRVLDGSVWLAR